MAEDRHRVRDQHNVRPGVEPRTIYDVGHTFATFALRAGISTFDLSQLHARQPAVIDRHYGHVARDGSDHAIRLLDELSAGQRPRWTLVDAAWTSKAASDASRDTGTVG